MRWSWVSWGSCLLAIVAVSSAGAVTQLPKTFTQLVREAETIVVGTVRECRSLRLPGGAIVTDVTLDVSRVVKASDPVGPWLVVRVLGGKADDLELIIEGAPTFRPRDGVLLFIRGNMRDMLPFVGVRQGVFRVSVDGRGGQHVGNAGGRPVAAIVDDQVMLGTLVDGGRGMPLPTFLQEVDRRLPR